MLADLEVKEEETRILKKGIEQLKMEINGQKIELDSKRAINQRVGQNEQNLFKQVTELKQQIAEGKASGNLGDFYDNRDAGHSRR